MSEKVVLALYDITNGLAKAMSMMFIGQQIDAVYHSSIVVYGRQYYFNGGPGGGIIFDNPYDTPFGKPIEKIQYGQTEIPKQVFDQYVKELGDKYAGEKYHLIDRNCNHFTDDACQFLTGKGIPKKVVDQAKQLLNTPMGQQFKPFLQQMSGNGNVANMHQQFK